MKRLIPLLALAALPAFGAPCDGLVARLDDLAKLTAKEEAAGFYDDSVPREQVRQTRLARYQTERNGIFMQMQSNACKLPTTTNEPEAYKQWAHKCRGSNTSDECELKNWKR